MVGYILLSKFLHLVVFSMLTQTVPVSIIYFVTCSS
jgi:hypothetical protein